MPFADSQRSKPSTLMTTDSTTITARLVAISRKTRFMDLFSFVGLRSGRLLEVSRAAARPYHMPRSLLRDDISRRIGVSRGYSRHYRGVDDPQSPHAAH